MNWSSLLRSFWSICYSRAIPLMFLNTKIRIFRLLNEGDYWFNSKSTIPPTHILTEDEKSVKILEINPISETEYTTRTYRPRLLLLTDDIFNDIFFDQTNSPYKSFKRSKIEEMKEIAVDQISRTELCASVNPSPIRPTTNTISNLYFALSEIYEFKHDSSLWPSYKEDTETTTSFNIYNKYIMSSKDQNWTTLLA